MVSRIPWAVIRRNSRYASIFSRFICVSHLRLSLSKISNANFWKCLKFNNKRHFLTRCQLFNISYPLFGLVQSTQKTLSTRHFENAFIPRMITHVSFSSSTHVVHAYPFLHRLTQNVFLMGSLLSRLSLRFPKPGDQDNIRKLFGIDKGAEKRPGNTRE